MKSPLRFALLFSASVLAFGCALPFAAAAGPAKKKVLFFSKSSGFEHDIIKTLDVPRYGTAFRVLRELGEKHAIEFTISKDGSLFSKEYLEQFDAFFFCTSGDLTLAKNDHAMGDGQPPMTAAGKQAFLDAIAGGKGFVGTHNASDTFLAPGNKNPGPARNEPDGDKTDPYGKMLGASFIKHDAQQKARMIIADPAFPGMDAVPADFTVHEEWYSLKNFATDLRVLLVQDTSTMEGPSYRRPNYPATWARMHGQGRVFFTSMGHRDDIWIHPVFQSILMGGLNWALRRVDADVTPNIAQVTPQANVLPKYVAPPPPKQTQATKQE